MPNWFIALPVSPLGWFERLVPPPPAGFRAFHPDDLHLTIAFLGAVDDATASRGWHA
jgi:2'-5' RNA ligase